MKGWMMPYKTFSWLRTLKNKSMWCMPQVLNLKNSCVMYMHMGLGWVRQYLLLDTLGLIVLTIITIILNFKSAFVRPFVDMGRWGHSGVGQLACADVLCLFFGRWSMKLYSQDWSRLCLVIPKSRSWTKLVFILVGRFCVGKHVLNRMLCKLMGSPSPNSMRNPMTLCGEPCGWPPAKLNCRSGACVFGNKLQGTHFDMLHCWQRCLDTFHLTRLLCLMRMVLLMCLLTLGLCNSVMMLMPLWCPTLSLILRSRWPGDPCVCFAARCVKNSSRLIALFLGKRFCACRLLPLVTKHRHQHPHWCQVLMTSCQTMSLIHVMMSCLMGVFAKQLSRLLGPCKCIGVVLLDMALLLLNHFWQSLTSAHGVMLFTHPLHIVDGTSRNPLHHINVAVVVLLYPHHCSQSRRWFVKNVVMKLKTFLIYKVTWWITLVAKTFPLHGIDPAAILILTFLAFDWCRPVLGAMQWTCQKGQAAKFRKMSEHEHKDHDLLVAVAKLSLKSAEEVKELQAACFRTILVPSDCEFASAAKDATTAYADQTRGKGGKHDLGEPHVHLWSAVVGVALKSANPDAQEVLQAHVDEANRGGPKSLSGKVHYARLKKTFDKKYVRFYFSVHASVDPVLDIIMASLTKMGGQEKYGTAPRSGLEREIQSKLDQLQWAVRTRVPLSPTRCVLCDDVISERVHSAAWWFWQWGPCFRTSVKDWVGVSIQ